LKAGDSDLIQLQKIILLLKKIALKNAQKVRTKSTKVTRIV